MSRLAIALLTLTACASTPPAPNDAAGARGVTSGERKRVAVGERAPAFEVRNASGGPPLRLVTGKVNLVIFWATWSAPDTQALQALEPVWKRGRAQGLVVTAISMDDDMPHVAEVAHERGATFDVAWDEGHVVTSAYGPALDPSIYIIDKKGIVRYLHGAYHDGDAADIQRELESLL